jgi:drug/metabolite transporter (DMT)-like permease
VHILIIDRFAKKTDALKLSLIQFSVCSVISLTLALLFENMTLRAVSLALIPLLYGGVCSVGVAYTLQAVGQRHSKPSHSAIILSLESVFSALGGALLLGENLGLRGYFGCLLMITGMLLSQLGNMGEGLKALRRRQKREPNEETAR